MNLLSVSWGAVFGNVKTFSFFFSVNADSHDHFQDEEDNEREDKGEDADRSDTGELNDEIAATEDSHCKRSPDSADSVNRDRTNWVVDLDLVQEEDGNNDQSTGDESHKD